MNHQYYSEFLEIIMKTTTTTRTLTVVASHCCYYNSKTFHDFVEKLEFDPYCSGSCWLLWMPMMLKKTMMLKKKIMNYNLVNPHVLVCNRTSNPCWIMMD